MPDGRRILPNTECIAQCAQLYMKLLFFGIIQAKAFQTWPKQDDRPDTIDYNPHYFMRINLFH